MAAEFKLSFKDLDKDIERHVMRFGDRRTIMGRPAYFGYEASRRAVFNAYVEAGADEAIMRWLLTGWDNAVGISPFFLETVARFCREGKAARVSRLWRHACTAQIAHYRALAAHRDLEGIDKSIHKSIAETKNLVLTSMAAWRSCLERLGEEEGIARLDRERADFEADRRKPVPKKPDPRKIDESLFWEIVGAPVPDGGAVQVEEIEDRLAAFPAAQIKAFDRHLWAVMQRLNHHDVWALAHLLQDGCSDDAFEAFRAGIILRGREACTLALDDPVGFLDRVDVGGVLDGSMLLDVPLIAYDRRTGKPMPPAKRPPASVQGTPWEEETVAKTYPRLAAKISALRDGP